MGRVSTSATAIPTGLQMFAPIAGAALAEWQSVGFVFAVAGGALAALGLAVVAARVPVGVGVSLQDAADVAVAAAEPRGEEPHRSFVRQRPVRCRGGRYGRRDEGQWPGDDRPAGIQQGGMHVQRGQAA